MRGLGRGLPVRDPDRVPGLPVLAEPSRRARRRRREVLASRFQEDRQPPAAMEDHGPDRRVLRARPGHPRRNRSARAAGHRSDPDPAEDRRSGPLALEEAHCRGRRRNPDSVQAGYQVRCQEPGEGRRQDPTQMQAEEQVGIHRRDPMQVLAGSCRVGQVLIRGLAVGHRRARFRAQAENRHPVQAREEGHQRGHHREPAGPRVLDQGLAAGHWNRAQEAARRTQAPAGWRQANLVLAEDRSEPEVPAGAHRSGRARAVRGRVRRRPTKLRR